MRFQVETERIFLRNMVPEDAEAAFLWCGDPNVNKYMIYPLYRCAEDVRTWLKSRNNDNPNEYDLGFVLKETGELIGSGGITYNAERDVWIIGYNLRADQWGHGYAVEAIQGLLDYVRQTRPVHAIEGQFAAENYKSQRVMEKLGMKFDHDSEYTKLDGSVHFKSKTYRRDFL